MNKNVSLMEAKNQRKYDAMRCHWDGFFSGFSAFSPEAAVVDAIFNSHEWFVEKEEEKAYFEYACDFLERFCGELQAMEAWRSRKVAEEFLRAAHFRHTVHNNEDIRRLMQARARLFEYALNSSDFSQNYQFSPSTNLKRFGVVFKHFENDPELTSIVPFFLGLKAHGVKITAFYTGEVADADCRSAMATFVDDFVPVGKSLGSAVSLVRSFDLDFLLFANDVTAKYTLAAMMSFCRLARKTAICVSSLVTTCSPYVDVYLGGKFYRENGCADEFAEAFWEMPDPGFKFWYPESCTERINVDRSVLGIGDEFAFVSGANQKKLHAPLIRVWSRILALVPGSVLVLYPFPPHFGPEREEVVSRVYREFVRCGIEAERIIICPGLPGRHCVLSLLSGMDLALDSFPYTGVTTVVDAVEAGLPTISLKGARLRSMQGAAILEAAGLQECVAESEDQYVELAVSVAGNSILLAKLREIAIQAKGRFLDASTFGELSASRIINFFRDSGHE